MIRLGVGFGAWILLGVLRAPWICGFVSDISWEEHLSHYSFRYSFCSLLSSSGVPSMRMLHLLSLCPGSWIFCSIFSHLCSLHFSVWGISTDITTNSESLSAAMSCLLTEPVRGILHFCDNEEYLWSLAFKKLSLRISISLLILPTYSCLLATFSAGTLSVVIRVI